MMTVRALANTQDPGPLADKSYQGSTYAKIPYKGKNKPSDR